MSEVPAPDRRAVTPRQELWGSTLSAVMALQFAAVVMLGKEVAAGDLPFPMLALRFAGQSVLLFIVLLLLRKPLTPAPGERLPLILAATIGYGTEAALFFSALNHGKAGAVTLLFYLYPVWVMLATIAIDRRPPGWRLFVALLLALGGSAVVIVGGGEVEVAPIGIFLALATSVAYTAYLITADRTIRKTDPVTAAAWLGAGAAIANVVFALAFQVHDLPGCVVVAVPRRHGRVLGWRVRRDARRAPARGRRSQRDHRRHGAAGGRRARRLLPRRTHHGPDGDRRHVDPRRRHPRHARPNHPRSRARRLVASES